MDMRLGSLLQIFRAYVIGQASVPSVCGGTATFLVHVIGPNPAE
jgi:hypothetical protein